MSTIGNRTDIWLSKCTSVQISNITKVCVQNALHVLECKLEDVDATAWSLHRWTPGGNVPTLRSGVTQLVNVMNPAAIHTLLQLPPNLACSEIMRWIFRTVSFLLLQHFNINTIVCGKYHVFLLFIVYANCLRWLRQHSVTSRHVTAVSNAVLEIFWHRYLNINNSAIK